MANKEDSKLTRIVLGGIEQIKDFTGNIDDYSFINRITFRGQKDGKNIMAEGEVLYYALYKVQEYDPTDADSFLNVLNELLEREGWYLAYCLRDRTCFRRHQRVESALYVSKEKKQPQKTE